MERLAARLGRRRFVGLYASDLRRAVETAAAIAAVVRIETTAEAGLREIYLGEWEGLSTDEIAARYPQAWSRWVEDPDWDVVPGGESTEAFDARVARAIDEIFGRHEHGSVLVVTHGGVIQAALHRIVGRPSHGLFPFRIQNASVSIIERRDGRMVIGAVNDTAHLDDD